jgi:hypothetical protein
MDQQTSPTKTRAPVTLLAAVLLLSASGLMFELTLTRVFSATIWYHYTFVAISVALFGWGLGGFLVYILRLARFEAHVRTILVVLSLLLALTLPLFLYGILQFPFTPERLNYYFLLSVLPFLAGGATLSLAFESHGRDVNRLYFTDLMGAALGTLAVPLSISLLGAETAILATAALPALAAVFLSLAPHGGHSKPANERGQDTVRVESTRTVPPPLPPVMKGGSRGGRAWTVVSVAALAGTVGLAAWNFREQKLTIRDAPGKALYKLLHEHPQARIQSDRWNAYSRITSVQGFDSFHLARLFIDSDAETSVLRWNGSKEGIPDGSAWFRAFPFRLAPEPNVLVIGPGGGTDVALSIVTGSPEVTAVEMNPLIVESVRALGAEAGNLYDHPKVHLVMDEGRNFIQRTQDRFDLIVLGFVDSWASVASGGLSLTENYLYTRDALEAYYDHLTERGALVIIRWPTDVPRLVANSVDLLSKRGLAIEEIGRHILAASSRKPEGIEPVETVFMLTRSPMTKETVEKLLDGHANAHIICVPSRQSEQPYADLFAGKISFAQYTDGFDTMATPVQDDRPFYFATEKPRGIPDFVVQLFKLPIRVVVGFAILLFIAGRILGFRVPGVRAIGYFGALGVGFIVCEVALMQRLILLLGHPIYTLVVILFTLLLAGGLGSFFAKRFAPQDIRRALGRILPLVVLLIVAGAFGLPPLVKAALPLNLGARIVVAGLLTFPFGFLMGMPFPLGLRRCAADEDSAPVSALWGINGVASVAGSIGGMMLAVAAGFTTVFLAGAACYAIAWIARPK